LKREVFIRKNTLIKMTARIIHQTDLFHPHEDPDDHWDLACMYALAFAGDVKLESVLVDSPLPEHDGQPDAMGIAQMNYITGLNVPFTVGSSISTVSRQDKQPDLKESDENGVRMLLDTLAESPDKVFINIVGSARDVAIAGNRAPELFQEKCAGIYLNAGTGTHLPDHDRDREHNVMVNPSAYTAIYDIPCPLYWMPCWGSRVRGKTFKYGTWYQFQQKEILEHISDRMQKFFAFMLGRVESVSWLKYLTDAKDEAILTKFGEEDRHMWCTAGFFHVAGKVVTSDGEIIDAKEAEGKSVFTFDPIDIQCDDLGLTKWTPGDESSNRYIFHVRDMDNYAVAMTKAMRTLLKTLP
jgi:hypothetical protein